MEIYVNSDHGGIIVFHILDIVNNVVTSSHVWLNDMAPTLHWGLGKRIMNMGATIQHYPIQMQPVLDFKNGWQINTGTTLQS